MNDFDVETGYLDKVIGKLKDDAPKSKLKSLELGMLCGIDMLLGTVEYVTRDDPKSKGYDDYFTFGAKAVRVLDDLEGQPNKGYRDLGACITIPFSLVSYLGTPFVSLSNWIHKKKLKR